MDIIADCDPGRFGKNCMQRCSVNCNVTSICDRFTGRCDGGCKLGWKGDTCDQSKRYKYLSI